MRDQLYLSVPLLKTMLAIGLVTVLVTAFLVVAVDFMDWILRRIRRASRIAERRHPSERGVPPEIVGSFERLLAFGLVLFVCDVRTVATVLTVWLGAKLAASWQGAFPLRRTNWVAPLVPEQWLRSFPASSLS